MSMLCYILLCFMFGLCSSALECDFETHCDWTFHPPTDSSGFRVMIGKQRNGYSEDIQDFHYLQNPSHYAHFAPRPDVNPAMIISPFYQYTGMSCELDFDYRLFGNTNAYFLITVQYMQPRPAEHGGPDLKKPILLHKIPNTQHFISSWNNEKVPIGQSHLPMRIRIEAWFDKPINPTNSTDETYKKNIADYFVDNITLNYCQEELYHPDPCRSNRTQKYTCSGSLNCIEWDQICDMSRDCYDGQDEDNTEHNCTSVPTGARCDFEEEGVGICRGWTTDTSKNKSSQWIRTNLIDYYKTHSYPSWHIPNDHTFNNQSGHIAFLWFSPKRSSSEFRDNSRGPSVNQFNLISPRFPPTSPLLHDPTSPYFNQCLVRFYVCSRGTSTNTARLKVSRPGYGEKTLWRDGGSHVSKQQPSVHICDWTRVSIPLPPQETDYQIIFSVMGLFSIEVAIDDFSMTPQCFIEDGRRRDGIAREFNFTSCNTTGPRGPSQSRCDAAYNNTDVQVQLIDSIDEQEFLYGVQQWVVPIKTEYRIVAVGASGGGVGNYGSRVEALFNLTMGDVLQIMVGQPGASPCSEWKTDYFALNYESQQGDILAALCNPDQWNDTQYRTHQFPGAGGGGASMVSQITPTYHDNTHNGGLSEKLMVIAGGGGGSFWGDTKSAHHNLGNILYENEGPSASGKSIRNNILVVSGGGGGYDWHKSRHCDDLCMSRGEPGSPDGGWLRMGGSGGTCDQHQFWKYYGGFGGGGASCGPGGGGGGGFIGGDGGNGTDGAAGSSFSSVAPFTQFLPNANTGPGYVRIIPCRQTCPQGSMCRFSKEAVQICVCHSGKILQNLLLDNCHDGGLSLNHRIQTPANVTEITWFQWLITAILLAFLVVVLIGVVACYHRARQDRKQKHSNYPGNSVRMQHLPSNAQSEFNPNYDLTGVFSEALSEIPRTWVTKVKVIGRGAFGEVYEGIMNNSTDPASNIAIKTLPELATEDSTSDFHMEALIMSKFQHPNIVKFLGVCFSRVPRLIVLELLKGGDLKTFLRENRPRTHPIISSQKSTVSLKMCDLIEMAVDVAKGCQYLEENHFIHRDIAARNCLLTTREAPRIVKIADFGMARDIYRADYYKKGGRAMLPVKWMPPEAFLDGIFTSKTDVWSFGVLLWEIFSMGYMPYPGRGNQEVMQLVTAGGRLETPNGAPACIYEIMCQCWLTGAIDRPKFSVIIDALMQCLKDPELMEMPLPALVYRQSLSMDPTDTSKMSDDPSRTLNSSLSCSWMEDNLQQHDPMPTKGTGVKTEACPPYKPQFTEPYLPLLSPKPSLTSSSVSDSNPTDALLPHSQPNTPTGPPPPFDAPTISGFRQVSSSGSAGTAQLNNIHPLLSSVDAAELDDVFPPSSPTRRSHRMQQSQLL